MPDHRQIHAGSAEMALAPRQDRGFAFQVCLALCMLLASLGTSIANVALPTFTIAFGASFQQVQWIVLAYLLAVTSFIVGLGRLGDLIGRRRLMLAGILIFTLASSLCALAPSLWILVAGRAAQGIGAAAMMALALAFAAGHARTKRVGKAMGLLGAASATGTALGPSLGGLLIATTGWRAIFLVSLPLGLLALILAFLALPEDIKAETEAQQDLDLRGSALLTATLAAYALAMTLGRTSALWFGLASAAAAILLLLFILVETRAAAPLIPLRLLRDPILAIGLTSSAIVSTIVMATLVVGPFYLGRTLRLPEPSVGLALSMGPIIVATSGLPVGRLVDRFGSARSSLIGLLVLAGGCLMLSIAPSAAGLLWYLFAVATITLGYAAFQTANNAEVMTRSTARPGLVSGLLNLSRNLGLISGASAMGAIFNLVAGPGDIGAAPPEAVAAAMRVTFTVATFLAMAAVAMNMSHRLARSPGLRT